MIRPLHLFILVLLVGGPVRTLAGIWYNVKDYGARGDGIGIESPAIQKAIEAAAVTGGTVYFPPGTYLSYTIHLRSNITLLIDRGATLVAAEETPAAGYDAPEPNPYSAYQDFGHSHWRNSLIYGEGLHDISIIGQGVIWGRGLTNKDAPLERQGNKSIALKLCRNVLIRDLFFRHGGHFALLATGVDNLTIDNVKMDTNRDGMDIDCCRNVRVSNCSVNSPADDGICLKSSFGLGVARATENVTITNCQVSGYDEGSFFDGSFTRNNHPTADHTTTGRIKMGTESNGGFKNIVISNCVFDYSRGLALETVDGGLLEDISVTNITMRDIVNAPIFIRLGGRMRGPDSLPAGQCRRIIISNVVVYNADWRHGVLITGLPGHDIEDLELSNIKIYYQGGGAREMAARVVPEYEKSYPDPAKFGIIPSWGFYIRHASDLQLHDIEVSLLRDDQRPAFLFDDVKNVDCRHVMAQKREVLKDGFYPHPGKQEGPAGAKDL